MYEFTKFTSQLDTEFETLNREIYIYFRFSLDAAHPPEKIFPFITNLFYLNETLILFY